MDSHRRIDHEAISKLLHQICTRFSWQPIMEKGNIIGATLENASVTLEPGGQFELSGAPLDSLHKTCSEVNSHLYEAGAPCPQVTSGMPWLWGNISGPQHVLAALDLHGFQLLAKALDSPGLVESRHSVRSCFASCPSALTSALPRISRGMAGAADSALQCAELCTNGPTPASVNLCRRVGSTYGTLQKSRARL